MHWITLKHGEQVRVCSPDDSPSFPDIDLALKEPAGLIQIGGKLSAEWLLTAYQNGIFPWYSQQDPILWWCPDPRTILIPQELIISRSLAKVIRNAGFRITFDTDFQGVIHACALTREETWIVNEMIEGYTALHTQGFAHSIEVWQDENLVGGLYGIALGKIFFGESMFAKTSNASKVALAKLCEQLIAWDFHLIDCQFSTNHLLSLGAKSIARDEFLFQLKESLSFPRQSGLWQHLNTKQSLSI